ncbi:adenine-specific methyltransferase EcoRI family protein [Pseudomonas sp. DWP3-1-2]|uniref:adenine-specific methyltransferase EcoRI family protein n=1 Tax=Pseudomonas sp. DWP3-1-2 TaxID=2804645 RepID=UPI003CE91417
MVTQASLTDTESKPSNQNLGAAKVGKQDEFYTQYVDIQKEVEAYLEFDPDTFRGKVVYCNCDDPFESNFFKYFVTNFNKLGLKKLVTTSYDGSPIAGEQLTFGEYEKDIGKHERPNAIAVEIEAVNDVSGDGVTGIEDVKLFLTQNPHSRTPLEGGGDFRSAECVELLKQADIVVTNPPFSLFKEYVAQLVEHEKRFLIIGNLQAITYLEIFPLIKDNKLWLGPTIRSGDREFRVPDHYPLKAAGWRVDENGVKYIRVKGVRWYTNLDHGRRHQRLACMTMEEHLRFSKHKEIKGKKGYNRYDNFDAIEVPFSDAIPSDFDGVMGVPVSFLDKYNPDQFEIVGNSDDGEMMKKIGARTLGREFIDAYRARGGTGHYSPGMRMLGLLEPQARVIFKRILIRHRCPTQPVRETK